MASPLAKIHFKSPAAPQVEPYTQEELKRLLAVCNLDIKTGARFTGLRNRAMLLLFLDAGLRRAEMATPKKCPDFGSGASLTAKRGLLREGKQPGASLRLP